MWTTFGLMAVLGGIPNLPPSPPLSLTAGNEALITNTGSTNTTGYRISVEPTGKVSYQVTHLQGHPPRPFQHPKAEATVEIHNTGSTNTIGYQIYVDRMGYASYAYTRNGKFQGKALPLLLTSRLFRDVLAAEPLNKLPIKHTFKSVSFGTSTYIEYKGQRTPDLSFPTDARGRSLQADIAQIAATLHLKNAPRRPVQMDLPDGRRH